MAIAFALDLFSLKVAIQWNQRGYGPSGIPFLPVFIYALGIYVLPIWNTEKQYLFLGCVSWHVAAQFIIPLGHRKWIGK